MEVRVIGGNTDRGVRYPFLQGVKREKRGRQDIFLPHAQRGTNGGEAYWGGGGKRRVPVLQSPAEGGGKGGWQLFDARLVRSPVEGKKGGGDHGVNSIRFFGWKGKKTKGRDARPSSSISSSPEEDRTIGQRKSAALDLLTVSPLSGGGMRRGEKRVCLRCNYRPFHSRG